MSQPRTGLKNSSPRPVLGCIAVASFFLFAPTVSAQVFISEIKYTGNEWVEVSNTGAPADLSLWKFFEGGTNHKLKPVQGGTTLASGGYAIIANDAVAFLNEYSGFSGILFDSSFSLLDAGEAISIKSSDVNIIDTVSYTGIKGSKNSTQKIDGVWREAVPTPGTGATSNVIQNANTNTQTTASSASTASSPATPQITAQAGPQTRVVLAGAPIIFEGKIAGLENNSSGAMRTTWSFGDGSYAEGESVSHTYYYPGEYTAILDAVSGGLTATDRMLVRVVLPNLFLSVGGDATRSFFTIENRGGDELDISGWQVTSDNKTFTFPKNTILGARRSATFASEITGLATPVGIVPELRFQNGSRVEVKTETLVPQEPVSKVTAANQGPALRTRVQGRALVSDQKPIQTPQNQQASVINALSGTQTSLPAQKEGNLWPWYIGSAFLGALALLGIRLTQSAGQKTTFTANDFEIVEETDDNKPY